MLSTEDTIVNNRDMGSTILKGQTKQKQANVRRLQLVTECHKRKNQGADTETDRGATLGRALRRTPLRRWVTT